MSKTGNMRKFFIILLIFLTEISSGQTNNSSRIDFIKAYRSVYCPVVPFAHILTEISNYQICHKITLPPRRKMKSEQLACYDSWDKKPKFMAIEKSDYDSIANFILNSGILNIGLDYTKSDTTGDIVMMKMGACSESYVIETSSGIVNLPIRNASVFELPVILEEFDILFQRIVNKYNQQAFDKATDYTGERCVAL
jgi:hypothetical protein